MRNHLIAAVLLASGAMACAAPPSWGGGSSQSGCQLSFEPTPSQWLVMNYDPFSGGAATGDFEGLFINNGDGVCDFTVGTDTAAEPFGLSRQGNKSRVAYTLYDALSGDDLTPTNGHSRTSATKRHLSVASHGQQVVKLHFETAEPFSGDGVYQQQLLVEADASSGEVLTQRAVTLGVEIDPQATVGLSGAFRRVNGQADVDLGTLEPGLAKVPLNLHVRSTRAYVITSSSLNGGNLEIAGTTWAIPYQLVFGGQAVSPDGGTYNGVPNGNSSVDELKLGFDIGDTNGKAGGTYGDIITLTIAVQ